MTTQTYIPPVMARITTDNVTIIQIKQGDAEIIMLPEEAALWAAVFKNWLDGLTNTEDNEQ